ncbi:hypothetical protein [Mycolicibacterium phocaicum]|uniref:hypothetical protein n=1 Tax=Mycolicibacterium phocaicum TaxID=319706 RepID=UPI001CF9CBF0|nr:hypothetical protein [Mycolicibacterium phocaicum]UCZ59763.1 hypothetical protein LHJ73_24280 [Mycolicibacterium phocaicum]
MSNQWPPGQFGPGQFGPGQPPGQPYGPNPYGAPGVPPSVPYPQYPQQQYPQPMGYGAPPPTGPSGPSGVTAIIAAVLSMLGAVSTAFQAFSSWYAVATLGALTSSYASEAKSSLMGLTSGLAVVQTIVAIVLLVGGVLLVLGRGVGRWIVIGGCTVVVLSNVIALFASLTILKSIDSTLGGSYDGMQAMAGLSVMSAAIPIVFALATGVLAALNSTQAWCRWKSGQSAPVAPVGYPGYPPQF